MNQILLDYGRLVFTYRYYLFKVYCHTNKRRNLFRPEKKK